MTEQTENQPSESDRLLRVIYGKAEFPSEEIEAHNRGLRKAALRSLGLPEDSDITPDEFVALASQEMIARRERLRAKFEEKLAPLTPRERLVLDLRYNLTTPGKGQTLEEIGKQIQRSETTVRRVINTALTKLRT